MDAKIAAERLEQALEMHDDGVAMYRETLRRRNPSATETELETALTTWLQERPGAEHGDGDGTPGSWPRRTAP